MKIKAMGKRKETLELKKSTPAEAESPSRRTRVQKPKRHRREIEPIEDFESDASLDMSFDDDNDSKSSFKIKFKNSPTEQLKSSKMDKRANLSINTSPKSTKKKKGRGRESGTSSEEERWLDAIESGKLEEVDDELKKIKPKDPKMMTARQRAMYERGNDKDPTSPGGEVLLSLPSGYKTKVMTAEAIQKAAIKAQKRKQLADEKREKDKKTTMERLLKKQESKAVKGIPKTKALKKSEPVIVYKNTYDNITVAFPPEVPFPLMPQSNLEAPKPIICGIAGCANLKRYSCSQTKIPLCSLECYKKNLHNVVVS